MDPSPAPAPQHVRRRWPEPDAGCSSKCRSSCLPWGSEYASTLSWAPCTPAACSTRCKCWPCTAADRSTHLQIKIGSSVFLYY
ncbi:hypothetical protein BRADI_2g16371v3 [Brachypodium distachyon]|uniref:Uncharacterized protein n=1 Tax=Brachypodium distachyon TaxID=15368 RepID=A0A2K2D8V9_BRADI|nr:hypothetical protein BRADI_2g16371v3 [Brachypodium distachyon]